MKKIIIDNISEDFGNITTEATAISESEGMKYGGWVIAKPLNYDPPYFTMEERKEMADAIMAGKAIAVCFFEDLNEDEKVEFLKGRLKK